MEAVKRCTMIWLNGCPSCAGDLSHYQDRFWFRVTCRDCGRSLNSTQVSMLLGYTSSVSPAPVDAPGFLVASPLLTQLRRAA